MITTVRAKRHSDKKEKEKKGKNQFGWRLTVRTKRHSNQKRKKGGNQFGWQKNVVITGMQKKN